MGTPNQNVTVNLFKGHNPLTKSWEMSELLSDVEFLHELHKRIEAKDRKIADGVERISELQKQLEAAAERCVVQDRVIAEKDELIEELQKRVKQLEAGAGRPANEVAASQALQAGSRSQMSAVPGDEPRLADTSTSVAGRMEAAPAAVSAHLARTNFFSFAVRTQPSSSAPRFVRASQLKKVLRRTVRRPWSR